MEFYSTNNGPKIFEIFRKLHFSAAYPPDVFLIIIYDFKLVDWLQILNYRCPDFYNKKYLHIQSKNHGNVTVKRIFSDSQQERFNNSIFSFTVQRTSLPKSNLDITKKENVQAVWVSHLAFRYMGRYRVETIKSVICLDEASRVWKNRK